MPGIAGIIAAYNKVCRLGPLGIPSQLSSIKRKSQYFCTSDWVGHSTLIMLRKTGLVHNGPANVIKTHECFLIALSADEINYHVIKKFFEIVIKFVRG